MNYIHKLAAFFSVLIGLSTVTAADDKRGREFSCLQIGNLPVEEVFYQTAEGMRPLSTVHKRRSESAPLEGEVFKLFIEEGKEDGTSNYRTVAQSKIPEKTKTVLFIISAAPEGAKLPIEVIAMDDSLASFPKGTFKFANFTSETFGVEFGGAKEVVKAKSLKLLKINMKPKGGFMQMTMYDTKGAPVFGKKLFGQPNNRFIVFIRPTENLKRPIEVLSSSQVVTKNHR